MFLCSISISMAALEYDVIVLLHLHGSHDVSKDQVCDMGTIPEDRQVTFLEAVECGTRNITNTAWYDYTRGLFDAFIQIFGPTRELASRIQKVLRDIKQQELSNEQSGMNTLLKEMLHDERAAKARKFKAAPGWDIKTLQRSYANREYEPDPTWPMHMIVVYVDKRLEERLPLNTNLSSVVQKPFSRKTLLDYLYEQGAMHPFIIDNSCGDVYADSPTAERSAVRTAKKTEKGGKSRQKIKLYTNGGTYRKSTRKKKNGPFTKYP